MQQSSPLDRLVATVLSEWTARIFHVKNDRDASRRETLERRIIFARFAIVTEAEPIPSLAEISADLRLLVEAAIFLRIFARANPGFRQIPQNSLDCPVLNVCPQRRWGHV